MKINLSIRHDLVQEVSDFLRVTTETAERKIRKAIENACQREIDQAVLVIEISGPKGGRSTVKAKQSESVVQNQSHHIIEIVKGNENE